MIVEERMQKILDDYEKLEQRVQHSEKEKKTLDKKYTQVYLRKCFQKVFGVIKNEIFTTVSKAGDL